MGFWWVNYGFLWVFMGWLWVFYGFWSQNPLFWATIRQKDTFLTEKQYTLRTWDIKELYISRIFEDKLCSCQLQPPVGFEKMFGHLGHLIWHVRTPMGRELQAFPAPEIPVNCAKVSCGKQAFHILWRGGKDFWAKGAWWWNKRFHWSPLDQITPDVHDALSKGNWISPGIPRKIERTYQQYSIWFYFIYVLFLSSIWWFQYLMDGIKFETSKPGIAFTTMPKTIWCDRREPKIIPEFSWRSGYCVNVLYPASIACPPCWCNVLLFGPGPSWHATQHPNGE